MKNIHRILTISLSIAFLLAISMPLLAVDKIPADVQKAINSINKDDGIAIINELASDEYEGRMTGQAGQWKTAHFVREHFQNAGLTPFGGTDTFYQNFSMATNRILPTPILEVKTDDTEYTKYEFGTNFICRGFSGSGDVKADVVFVGYGITTKNYDDYANVDVKGKIAFMVSGRPPALKDEGQQLLAGEKVNNAVDHGAIGVILIASSAKGHYESVGLTCSVFWGDVKHQPNIPVVVVDRFVAADIMAKSEQDLPVLESLINKDLKPYSYDTQTMARIRVEAIFEPVAGTCNVVGLLKGSDPKLKNEYIIVGAHMDHVGIQGKDILFPGGNDNASGIASLLGVAQVFADSGIKPKRSIIFVAFTGEEIGLKGSKYFVDHMGMNKDKVKAMINFDMVGEGTNLMTFSKEYPLITNAVQKANKNLHNLEIIVGPSGHGSDHVSFVEAGIPATMLLTDGEWGYPYHHTHYHHRDWMMSMDNWKKATDTAFLATWYLAN